jgi:hypothetical protein
MSRYKRSISVSRPYRLDTQTAVFREGIEYSCGARNQRYPVLKHTRFGINVL